MNLIFNNYQRCFVLQHDFSTIPTLPSLLCLWWTWTWWIYERWGDFFIFLSILYYFSPQEEVVSSMEDGSGDGEERASGKEDRVEQGLLLGRELVVELVMRVGEDLSRVEEGREVVTGEDLLPGEVIRVGRAVRVVVVVVGRDSSRAT